MEVTASLLRGQVSPLLSLSFCCRGLSWLLREWMWNFECHLTFFFFSFALDLLPKTHSCIIMIFASKKCECLSRFPRSTFLLSPFFLSRSLVVQVKKMMHHYDYRRDDASESLNHFPLWPLNSLSLTFMPLPVLVGVSITWCCSAPTRQSGRESLAS